MANLFTEQELRELAEFDARLETEAEAFAEQMVQDEVQEELDAILDDLAMEALLGSIDWRKMKRDAEYKRKYYEAHKDEIAEYKRKYKPAYRAKNREKYNAYMREYVREYNRGKRRRDAAPVSKIRKEVIA